MSGGGRIMKKMIGILSIILFLIDEFDSCAVELGNALGGVRKVDGTAGMVLGLFMLVAGILSLCSKKYRGRIIASIIFYCAAAFIGYCNIGSFNEIRTWIIVNIAFAILLLINLIVKWKKYVFTEEELELIREVKIKHKDENEETEKLAETDNILKDRKNISEIRKIDKEEDKKE